MIKEGTDKEGIDLEPLHPTAQPKAIVAPR